MNLENFVVDKTFMLCPRFTTVCSFEKSSVAARDEAVIFVKKINVVKPRERVRILLAPISFGGLKSGQTDQQHKNFPEMNHLTI
jgi:hypothetical protein